jgi:hypothetical protein
VIPDKIKFAFQAIAKSDARLRPYIFTVLACLSVAGIGKWYGLSLVDTVIAVLAMLLLVAFAMVVTAATAKFPWWLQRITQILFVCGVAYLLYTFCVNANSYARVRMSKFEREELGGPPPLNDPPDKIILRPQIGRDYFANITHDFNQTSDDGIRKTTERLIIKHALNSLSSTTNDWQSLVLSVSHFVSGPTKAATYSLNVNEIENHGVDYSRTEPPLVVYFGWIARLDSSGRLALVPLQCKGDTSGPEFKLQFTLPIADGGDDLVICLQRKPAAKPPTFDTADSFRLNRIGP